MHLVSVYYTITVLLLTIRIMQNIALSKAFGNIAQHIESLWVALGMLLVTILFEYISFLVMSELSFNWFEFVGTWTGLVCVWLSRTQNVLCWPWGIISAGAFGFFFSQIGLPGQQWLNWGYFFLIQIWAWRQWVVGGSKEKELLVTKLSSMGRVITFVAVITFTTILYFLIYSLVPGSLYPVLDALVVAATVTAQYLMGLKKIESWVLWLGPVNLLSITLFYIAGAYLIMALYVAFFIHALFALRTWGSELK